MKTLWALTMLGLAARSVAAEASDVTANTIFFETEVKPVLEQRCWKCHSELKGKAKGGLTLDSLSEILTGGDSGEPALIPHEPKNSLMIAAVRRGNKDLAMPPEADDALTEVEIATLENWISIGAPWPGASVPV